MQRVWRRQVNLRVKVDYAGSNIPQNTDLLVPLYWIEQYSKEDSASPALSDSPAFAKGPASL